MKVIRIISRIIAGIVFIFSGFVKGIDPIGYTYKIQDYFTAFYLDFFGTLALPIAVILSTAELVIGFNLLIGIRMKLTSWVLLLFMSFFTILTFILAIFNPVSDCGCFGDAVKLTNWQTFWKNIILLVPALIIFLQRDHFKSFYANHTEWTLAILFVLFGLFLSLNCYRNLPYMDFRPYSVGTYIPDKMKIPEGMPVDEYETILVYEKNGIQKEFTAKNFPWQDTTWKWVETKQKLIKKGYEPPIHDFIITSETGTDITEDILFDPACTFLIIAYDLYKSNRKAFEELNKAASEGKKSGFKFYMVTSSTKLEIASFRESVNPSFEICTADEIMLKTIIRSNPGIVLLRKGTILGKWHYRNFKYPDFRKSDLDSVVLSHYRDSIEKHKVMLIFALFFLVFCIFHRAKAGTK
ncbi:MAG: DoxX family protein [Bacteroidales bacterium]|nr:DoxX family protein [Bacteroidales bacterium]